MNLYVVIGLDLGWDSIVGIFDASKVTKEEVEELFSRDDGYLVQEKDLETNLNSYE